MENKTKGLILLLIGFGGLAYYAWASYHVVWPGRLDPSQSWSNLIGVVAFISCWVLALYFGLVSIYRSYKPRKDGEARQNEDVRP